VSIRIAEACVLPGWIKMDDDHIEAYKGGSIIVTVSTRLFEDTTVERFTPCVEIVQLQEPQQRFIGVPRGAAFLDRCDAIRHGIAAANTLIDALVDKGARAERRVVARPALHSS
jgi:hypothetical protein